MGETDGCDQSSTCFHCLWTFIASFNSITSKIRTTMATTTTLRWFNCRQFSYTFTHKQLYATGLTSFLSYSTKPKSPTNKMSLPKVFFDMTANGEPLGRITIEVRNILIHRNSVLFSVIQFVHRPFPPYIQCIPYPLNSNVVPNFIRLFPLNFRFYTLLRFPPFVLVVRIFEKLSIFYVPCFLLS